MNQIIQQSKYPSPQASLIIKASKVHIQAKAELPSLSELAAFVGVGDAVAVDMSAEELTGRHAAVVLMGQGKLCLSSFHISMFH